MDNPHLLGLIEIEWLHFVFIILYSLKWEGKW